MSVMSALIFLLYNVLISQLFNSVISQKPSFLKKVLRSIKGYNSIILNYALLDIASFSIFNILKTYEFFFVLSKISILNIL